MRSVLLLLVFCGACAGAAELGRHFQNIDGTFVLLDGRSGRLTIHNRDHAQKRFAPCSTFKIPNSAIALETGNAPDLDFRIAYDAARHKANRDAWARDHTLQSAYATSAVWYYQELARKAGPQTIKKFLDQFKYGNEDSSGPIDQFWLGNPLRISAEEQVQFLRKLHEGRLGLSERTTRLMKQLMVAQTTPEWTLSGKTGACGAPGEPRTMWYVGWVERAGNVSYFALHFSAENYEPLFSQRVSKATAILLDLGVITPWRQVAITIDDLPRGGDTGKPCTPDAVREFTIAFLKPLREAKVPFIGFVNEGRSCGDLKPVFEAWLDAGADLGNHTATHPNLNNTPLEQFRRDVIDGETIIRPLLAARGRKLTWFRHPFLHVGSDLETRTAFEKWLAGRGYRVAPVTLDNSDWMFAVVFNRALERGDQALAQRVKEAYLPYMESVIDFFERRSVEVVGREFPQTLLIHANELNRQVMPALLEMFRNRGYAFVSLDAAMADPAYALPDTHAGPGGFSWIHRWSRTKGIPGKGEPDEPGWIAEEYRKLR